MLPKSFGKSWEKSEDNNDDIPRKDLHDDDEPIVDESMKEGRSTPKDVEEGLPRDKSKILRSSLGHGKWWRYS